jgi:hypothetical protein
LHARTETEDRASGRINVEYVALLVYDDDAVIDVPQYRQHCNVSVRQAMLQSMPLHGMFEYGFLALDGNIVDANVGLRAGANGGNAPMFTILAR